METKTTALQNNSKWSKIKTNISTVERIIMITSGAYLLYNGTSKDKKSVGLLSAGGALLLRGITGYCPMYDAVDHLKNDIASNVNIQISSVINKPVGEVYAFWRDLQNLPKFMTHLESVKPINSKTSKWTAKGPAGIGKLTWKAEIVKEEYERFIGWNSLPDSNIKNAGKVVFTPIDEATQIDVTLSYHAPLGLAGESAARLLNPYFKKLVETDILNFKSYIESLD